MQVQQEEIDSAVVQRFLNHRMDMQREYFLHSPYLIEQQLLRCVQSGNNEGANMLLGKINQRERAMLALQPLRSLKNSLICSCTLLTRAIINGGVPPEMAFNISDAYILEIERTGNAEALKQLEFSMLDGFISRLKEIQRQRNVFSHPIHLAVLYIHENILQKFTLEGLAAHVYLSPGYLSHQFRKEVGLSITQYINRKRIEESIYFLLQTNSSISEIALLFHFCNQSYYTNLFRKHCGMTPSEYRGSTRLEKRSNQPQLLK
ncbi:MAG: AraC family transcriptional regulator [Sporolactobacillus sp.]